MRTRRNSYGETGKRKRKLFDLNPDSDSSSSFFVCSSKMNSILTNEQDKIMLRYLHAAAKGEMALGESYSYNWWTRLAERLSLKFNTSVGTDACIMASRVHESCYMQYYQKQRKMLKHPSMDPAEYLQVLHDVYRKDKKRVLTHPSLSGGPMRGSGSGGPMRTSGSGCSMRASGSGSRSHGMTGSNSVYCHSDAWHDWEEKLSPLLMDLYHKDLLTSLEVDQIAAHFKNAQTRVGIKLFLSLNLPAARVKYIKGMLA